jgi:phosphoglycerate-specific signal transduction histidine kinase
MEDADLANVNLLSDKMKINLHMLGALMLNRVGGEVHGADIVIVDKGTPRRWGLELVEQLSQPSGLSHAVGNGMILGLSAGAGDNSLPLGRQENQVVP